MSAKTEKSTVGSAVELVVIVAVALGLALGIQAFLVKPYRIPSESMVPTLIETQRVLVNRIGTRFGSPKIGDVTVFHPPLSAAPGASDVPADVGLCAAEPGDGQACAVPGTERSEENFIKRIVAGPGDTVAVVDGQVVRNGKPQDEPFVQKECDSGAAADFPKTIRIPAHHYFMMGDNRQCSQDSRFWGPVPEEWIIGNAFSSYWPPKKVGLL